MLTLPVLKVSALNRREFNQVMLTTRHERVVGRKLPLAVSASLHRERVRQRAITDDPATALRMLVHGVKE